MDKKALSERDICTKFITPALKSAGWDVRRQIREEVTYTKGRIIVRGKMVSRGKKKRADYVLYHKPNLPLAVVEAKDNNHSVGDGMQQALDYATDMDIPFAVSSNGDAFLFHDRTGDADKVETTIPLSGFSSPQELWERYRAWKGLSEEQEKVVAQDYHTDVDGKQPRYYQQVAINRTLEAIAKGRDRLLLVMATGTGKTYTAFQIIWRLWKAREKKRILFLADRNILVDQTKTNDFKPFGQAMTKITDRTADPSYEIFLALYQALTGHEERLQIYKEFSPDFFDLIVIDECHRGSAKEDSVWREILDYFSSATHIGMTATPKETKYVSNIDYFGEPVYTYSLKQGIADGFLAPYKVIRIDLDKDLTGWRPEQGKLDDQGLEIEDRIYNQRDFDRKLVLRKRTQLVATKVSQFLKETDRYDKTIVFCEDIDHAERMRQALVNENADIAADNQRYVVRITGDNEIGKAELDNFIHPESRYPVIATTSRLMSTGVDAQTCKVVVLDRTINSMTEFKQIIGRGTRVNEDYDKYYFTIIDFRKATEHFADPEFDGEPVQVYEPGGSEPVAPEPPDPDDVEPDEEEEVLIDWDDEPDPPDTGKLKYVVGDVEVMVVAERVQYYGPDGRLITESLKDYTRKKVSEEFESLGEFLKSWNAAERKEAVIRELEEQGVLFEALAEDVGRDFDPFDLICHVVFDERPLTRSERAKKVREAGYFEEYSEDARAVLDGLLDKYAEEGIEPIEDMDILRVSPLSELGTPMELVDRFGGKREYQKALKELEGRLYEAA